MVFIIDGDNSPGSKTKGVELLNDKDELFIFYAENNNYYTKKERRKNIEDKSNCAVKWITVPAGNCSADIGAAMKLSIMLEEGACRIFCLISDDKHFNIIGAVARNMFNKAFVVCESSISNAITKYRILEQNSLEEIQKCLINMYGSNYGKQLYQKLNTLFTRKKFRRFRKWFI